MTKYRGLKYLPGCANPEVLVILVKSLVAATISLYVGWCFVPIIIQWIISYKVAISPSQSPEFYSAWLRPPIPVYFKVTLFNVTNADEIESGGQPRFNEVGPYIFEEIPTKQNITLDDASDTASYLSYNRFHFRPELSGGLSLDDKVTIINIPFAAAAIKIERDVPWPLNHVAHTILLDYEEPLFVQKTVDEILFQGWRVPFLDQIEEELGLTFIPNNTFGFFWEMNTSHPQPYTVDRGLHGPKHELGKILSYKHKPFLPFWGNEDSQCNQIRGTDGFIFAPVVTRDTVLRVFNADLCGSLHLEYVNDTEISGISGYHFTVPSDALEDPWYRDEVKCYCVNGKDQCLGTGALDLGPCRDGAPIALSLPHFLDADPKYLEDIKEGVKPQRNLHETFVDLEPYTGIVLQAGKRIQLSLILKRVGSIPSLRQVKEMLFPCVWADEGARLEGPFADMLREIIFVINLIEAGGRYLSVLISIFYPLLLFWTQLKLGESVMGKKIKSKSYTGVDKLGKLEKIVQEKCCLKCSDSNDYDDVETCRCEDNE